MTSKEDFFEEVAQQVKDVLHKHKGLSLIAWIDVKNQVQWCVLGRRRQADPCHSLAGWIGEPQVGETLNKVLINKVGDW